MDDSLTRLVTGLWDGERDAQAKFYEMFVRRVYGLARRCFGSGDVADEITQEVFLRVFAKPPDPSKPVNAYVLRITANLVRDQWRRRGIDPLPEEGVLSADSGTDPLVTAERSERAAAVRAALLRLAPDDRVVLVLRHYEGYSNAEISDICQISVSATEKKYQRAVARIRKLLPASHDPAAQPNHATQVNHRS